MCVYTLHIVYVYIVYGHKLHLSLLLSWSYFTEERTLYVLSTITLILNILMSERGHMVVDYIDSTLPLLINNLENFLITYASKKMQNKDCTQSVNGLSFRNIFLPS